jgi:predicted  nucleic acid-binding Zn-ribbon protein
MIQEIFLISAVNIRRRYLKISNQLDIYNKKTKDTLSTLNDALKKLDELKQNIKNANSGKGSKITEKEAFSGLLKIIGTIEDEGKSIEKLTEPINKEIERLSLEEQELYNQIIKNHPELTEIQIVHSVKQRLLSEGLS